MGLDMYLERFPRGTKPSFDNEGGEEICYWRKANAIHKWFVDNVQGGIDDCNYHDEVTEDKLKELLHICDEIVCKVRLVPGKMCVGYSSTNGGELTPTIIDGRVVDKPEICEGLLPAQSGFFFGSTDYDESYMADVLQTIKHIAEILVETDFETDAVYYLSSW